MNILPNRAAAEMPTTTTLLLRLLWLCATVYGRVIKKTGMA